MIDFTKKPFSNEDKAIKKFASKKLITKEEFDSEIEYEDFDSGTTIIDTESVVGGDAFDLHGLDGLSGGGSDVYDSFGFGEDLEGGSVREHQVENDYRWQRDKWWENWLFAPFYLATITTSEIIYNKKSKEDWISVLKELNKITIFSAIISLILWLIGFKFIFNLGFQSVTSVFMFVCSYSLLKFVFKVDPELPFSKKSEEASDDLMGDLDMGDGFDLLDMDDEVGNLNGDVSLIDEDDNIEYASDEYEMESNGMSESEVAIYDSPIDVTTNESFKYSLLQAFKANQKYQGVEITNRLDLMKSLSSYIVTNDKNFGSWFKVNPRSNEGVNMCYSIYKALIKINKGFAKDEERFIVYSIKKNPLLFSIDVELPDYYTQKNLRANLSFFESMLKRDESDDKVSASVVEIKGIFTFKFLNLENPNLISMGDIFRFKDDTKPKTALEEFVNPKVGMPMLLGLRGNEYPIIVDFEDNTSGTIVGGSGSGKSWLTFSLMMNFFIANDYNNTQFIILDKKNALFWNNLALAPHVLGYHTDPTKYLELFREIYEEVQRRKRYLNEVGEENVKSLRKNLRESGDTEGLKKIPLLTIIVDEITSTMTRLKAMYDNDGTPEKYMELKTIMGNITEEGRSLGVRLLVIGQRAIDTSVPKNVMMNSSLKFGMRMENQTEFETMFGKEVNNIKKPDSMGIGLLRSFSTKGISEIKSLTVGGANDTQVGQLLRVLALEWARRAIGQDDVINPPVGVNLPNCYNRNIQAKKAMEALRNGYILDNKTQSPDCALDFENINNKSTYDSSKYKDNPLKNHSRNIQMEDDFIDEDDFTVDASLFEDDDSLFKQDDEGTLSLGTPSTNTEFDDEDDDEESPYNDLIANLFEDSSEDLFENEEKAPEIPKNENSTKNDDIFEDDMAIFEKDDDSSEMSAYDKLSNMTLDTEPEQEEEPLNASIEDRLDSLFGNLFEKPKETESPLEEKEVEKEETEIDFTNLFDKHESDLEDKPKSYIEPSSIFSVNDSLYEDEIAHTISASTNGELTEITEESINALFEQFNAEEDSEEFNKEEADAENDSLFGDVTLDDLFASLDEIDDGKTDEELFDENFDSITLFDDLILTESKQTIKITQAIEEDDDDSIDLDALLMSVTSLGKSSESATNDFNLTLTSIDKVSSKPHLQKVQVAEVDVSDEPKISVKKYIIENGNKHGLRVYKIPKDNLERVYSSATIQKAVDKMIVILENDMYITTL